MKTLHALAALLLATPAFAIQLASAERIEASDPDGSDHFGAAVDLFGDVAVIGAPGDDEEGINCGAVYVFRRVGGSWTEEVKLTAGADAVQFDEFGTDVAVERNLIVVGTPGDDEAAGGGSDSGAAYVFEHDGATWTRIAKLLPSDPSNAGYAFGASVDISIAVPDENPPLELTNIVVGAPRAVQFDGLTYLFQRNGVLWDPIGRLVDSDNGGPNDHGETGTAVAIRGDSLVTGAPKDDQVGSNAGAAYLFGRGQIINSWTESAALYPSDPVPGDNFGAAVDVDKLFGLYTVVIGAPSAGSTGSPGRIFIYDTAGGPTVVTAGADRDAYGAAVALDGDHLAVGAPGDDTEGQDAGAVYFLIRDSPGSWQPDGMLTAFDAAVEREFGAAVAWHGPLFVGQPEVDAFTAGATYAYTELLFTDGFETGDTSAWDATTR